MLTDLVGDPRSPRPSTPHPGREPNLATFAQWSGPARPLSSRRGSATGAGAGHVPHTAQIVVVVLVYGSAVHVVQLAASGFNPYPDLPSWLRVYFIALTGLDPLAAVLLARRRRSGVVLAVVVLGSDAAANGFANYVLDRAVGVTAGRVGHTVIMMLAIGVCAAASRLWRTASSLQRHP